MKRHRVALVKGPHGYGPIAGAVDPGEIAWESITRVGIDGTGFKFDYPTWTSFAELYDLEAEVVVMCYYVLVDGLDDLADQHDNPLPNFAVGKLPTPLAPHVEDLIKIALHPNAAGRVLIPASAIHLSHSAP